MQPNQRAVLLKQMALVSSSGSPLLLICMLALAGLHIELWMILGAVFLSFAMLITGAMAAARLSSTKQVRSLQSDTVSGITTSATKKQQVIAPLKWSAKANGGAQAADIVIHAADRKQSVLGFGGALTGASCKVLNRLPVTDRARVMLELFHPQQANLNVVRVSIGSSDYHPELYSYCDQPGIENFSIDRDRDYVLPVLKLAMKINPNMYLFASPWSPPGWMKPNGTMLGGAMSNTHFAAYAQYFVNFLDAYRDEGLEVQALTIQNETEADQGGKMPACTWTRELECEFVTNHLGPALEAEDADVEIWMMDHNFDMPERAIASLQDVASKPGAYSKSIAWHGYGGNADAVSRVKAAVPGSEHHFTEFNTFIDAPDYWTNWTYWGKQIGEAMRNWCRDYVMWNIALDEHGKPNIGPFTCGGIVTIDSSTGEMLKSGGFYGLTHYSRYVRRGAVVVESSGVVVGVTHVAFLNSDGTKVLVLSNAGDARDVVVEYDDSGKVMTVPLDADSVTTLVWA